MKITQLAWTPEAWDDYQYWLQKDKAKLKRINKLIKEIMREPFDGLGKPEKLKYIEGAWSRRINFKHRLVYKVKDQTLYIVMCRYHYE